MSAIFGQFYNLTYTWSEDTAPSNATARSTCMYIPAIRLTNHSPYKTPTRAPMLFGAPWVGTIYFLRSPRELQHYGCLLISEDDTVTYERCPQRRGLTAYSLR